MPYCPRCLTEYVAGATDCMDCGVALLPGPPPPAPAAEEEPNVNFVPVRVFQGLHAQFEAELARNVLEAEGIAATVTAGFGAEMLPGADRVQLLVREESQARASQVLDDYLSAPVEEAGPGDYEGEPSAEDDEPA